MAVSPKSSVEALIPKNGVLFNYAHQAMAPSKDYCQIVVSTEQVIFRIWKISSRKNTKVQPGEIKDSCEDFLYDEKGQRELYRVFGANMVEYVKNLCQGHIDYLPRLPSSILVRIIRYLPLQDVGRLAATSKQFRELCKSDALWEKIYNDHSETPPSDDLKSLAEAIGWRKLFFTHKLKVQVQLRRIAREKGENPDFIQIHHLQDSFSEGEEEGEVVEGTDIFRLTDIESSAESSNKTT